MIDPDLLAMQSATVIYGWAAAGPVLLIFAALFGLCALGLGWLVLADRVGMPAWLSVGLMFAVVVVGFCLFVATVGIRT